MIVVIFEFRPRPGRGQDYLDFAAALRPRLEEIDGFISVERFRSLTDDSKILALSLFRDEAAVSQWRQFKAHRKAQARGREEIFETYRLRVATVIRDYGMSDRSGAPDDSRAIHDR